MGPALISTAFATKGRVLSVLGVVMLAAVACGGSGEVPSSAGADATAPRATATPTGVTGTGAAKEALPETAAVTQGNPDTPDITGVFKWLNGQPTSVEAEVAAGNVVLIDFWTYTCVNCIRTIPHLKAWQEKYGDRGLTILGVHSPEFDFEKLTGNVEDAIARLGVTWRVAQDNEMATWRAFGNRFWPAKYLFSTDDEIVYTHFGEGQYAETEMVIREQLAAAGHDVSDIPFEPLPEVTRDEAATSQTRELYGGYHRAYNQRGVYNGQRAYYSGPDQVLDYDDPGDETDGQYFLRGPWENRAESIVHAREDPGLEDYLRIPFSARSVNIVIEPAGPEPFEVVVTLDGRPLAPEDAGKDIVIKEDGTSVIEVTDARMYGVVEASKFTQGDLKFRSTSDNFAMFAFTFGTYLEGV